MTRALTMFFKHRSGGSRRLQPGSPTTPIRGGPRVSIFRPFLPCPQLAALPNPPTDTDLEKLCTTRR